MDVEQAGVSVADVDRALAICDLFMGNGLLTGIYSAPYVFENNGWLGVTKWSNRPLWDVENTHRAVLGGSFVPFGGWVKPAMTQYNLDTSIGRVHALDLDVMAA